MVAGSSYLSQNALERHFGLGDAARGTLEVQWPGGVRNRLYRVRRGERLEQPEIPCSIDTDEALAPYAQCVTDSLRQLRQAGMISGRQSARLWISALIGYLDEH